MSCKCFILLYFSCVSCCCCCCCLVWCLFDKNDCTLDFLLKHQPSGIKKCSNWVGLKPSKVKDRWTIRFNINVNYASTKQLDSQLRLGYTNKYVLCIVLVLLAVVLLLILVLVYQKIYNICQKICYRSWCLLKYVCFCVFFLQISWLFSVYKHFQKYALLTIELHIFGRIVCVYSLSELYFTRGTYIAK